MGPKPPKPQLRCAKCYQPLISGVVLIDWLAFVTRRKPGPVDVVFYEGRYFHRRCCAQQVGF